MDMEEFLLEKPLQIINQQKTNINANINSNNKS